MRVTGLPRAEADPLMARLMLDHEGEVDVGDEGGLVYRFEALRRTATDERTARPDAAWERPPELPPLTGNSAGANFGVAALNAFNLLASAWVIDHGLTVDNIALLFQRHPPRVLPDDGVPIALGLVPLAFSVILFVLPIARALYRSRAETKLARERARLAVLREVVTRTAKKEPIPDAALRSAVRVATGTEPTSQEVTRQVVELGGDVDLAAAGEHGEVRYRFPELEADEEAAREERARASEDEAQIGRVVFASDA
jgi:hypothetical protein